MSGRTATTSLAAGGLVRLCREATADPVAVDHGRGCEFWTTDDRRLLDFNSQLWCVNAGSTR